MTTATATEATAQKYEVWKSNSGSKLVAIVDVDSSGNSVYAKDCRVNPEGVPESGLSPYMIVDTKKARHMAIGDLTSRYRIHATADASGLDPNNGGADEEPEAQGEPEGQTATEGDDTETMEDYVGAAGYKAEAGAGSAEAVSSDESEAGVEGHSDRAGQSGSGTEGDDEPEVEVDVELYDHHLVVPGCRPFFRGPLNVSGYTAKSNHQTEIKLLGKFGALIANFQQHYETDIHVEAFPWNPTDEPRKDPEPELPFKPDISGADEPEDVDTETGEVSESDYDWYFEARPEPATIINLMEKDIEFHTGDNILRFPKAGKDAAVVSYRSGKLTGTDGLAYSPITVSGKVVSVENLPGIKAGVVLIVSEKVAMAMAVLAYARPDIVTPDLDTLVEKSIARTVKVTKFYAVR